MRLYMQIRAARVDVERGSGGHAPHFHSPVSTLASPLRPCPVGNTTPSLRAEADSPKGTSAVPLAVLSRDQTGAADSPSERGCRFGKATAPFGVLEATDSRAPAMFLRSPGLVEWEGQAGECLLRTKMRGKARKVARAHDFSHHLDTILFPLMCAVLTHVLHACT